MKMIYYNLCTIVNAGTDEEPDMQEVLSAVTLHWSEANEEIAKQEAHNGEYTIQDDGKPEPEPPSSDDSVWDELDAAYQAGYQEGVDSV